MEKSLEQLKHIERISRQTRHHHTYLNQTCNQKLNKQLNHLNREREQSIVRSKSRRHLEEERKQLINITIQQLAKERELELASTTVTPSEQEPSEVHSKTTDDSRPSSAIQFPCTKKSCRLFSHNCQLYPCEPIYKYTSITNKEHDQILRRRNSFDEDIQKSSDNFYIHELFTTIQRKKHQQNRRQLALTIQNQSHQVNRYVALQRTIARLNEQSRILHEKLADKKVFGYTKERQQKLSQAIQRHLEITAKFCA